MKNIRFFVGMLLICLGTCVLPFQCSQPGANPTAQETPQVEVAVTVYFSESSLATLEAYATPVAEVECMGDDSTSDLIFIPKMDGSWERLPEECLEGGTVTYTKGWVFVHIEDGYVWSLHPPTVGDSTLIGSMSCDGMPSVPLYTNKVYDECSGGWQPYVNDLGGLKEAPVRISTDPLIYAPALPSP